MWGFKGGAPRLPRHLVSMLKPNASPKNLHLCLAESAPLRGCSGETAAQAWQRGGECVSVWEEFGHRLKSTRWCWACPQRPARAGALRLRPISALPSRAPGPASGHRPDTAPDLCLTVSSQVFPKYVTRFQLKNPLGSLCHLSQAEASPSLQRTPAAGADRILLISHSALKWKGGKGASERAAKQLSADSEGAQKRGFHLSASPPSSLPRSRPAPAAAAIWRAMLPPPVGAAQQHGAARGPPQGPGPGMGPGMVLGWGWMLGPGVGGQGAPRPKASLPSLHLCRSRAE